MGAYLTGTGVHYRQDDVCLAAFVLNDSPNDDPPNSVLDLAVFDVNLGVVVTTFRDSVLMDTATPKDTNGRWHDHGAMDCPGQNP